MESSTYDIIATISNETILNPSFSLICVCAKYDFLFQTIS